MFTALSLRRATTLSGRMARWGVGIVLAYGLVALVTLPVRPKAELQASSQQILERRPDLLSAVQTILLERLPLLTRTPS